jgi:hypothetical protein
MIIIGFCEHREVSSMIHPDLPAYDINKEHQKHPCHSHEGRMHIASRHGTWHESNRAAGSALAHYHPAGLGTHRPWPDSRLHYHAHPACINRSLSRPYCVLQSRMETLCLELFQYESSTRDGAKQHAASGPPDFQIGPAADASPVRDRPFLALLAWLAAIATGRCPLFFFTSPGV